jgi:hypothetical protein
MAIYAPPYDLRVTRVTRGNRGFGKGMQQLGTTSDHPVPLLAHTGQVAGHIDEDEERDAEGVTHAHESRGLLGRGRVQTAAQTHGVVGHDADRASTETAQGGRDVGSPLGVQLETLLGIVEDVVDQWVNVIGAPGRLRERPGQVAFLHRAHVEPALVPEQRAELLAAFVSRFVRLGHDVDDSRGTAVWFRAAEAQRVDVFAGDSGRRRGRSRRFVRLGRG